MSIEATKLDFCVLIPCYNDAEGLIIALKSIHYNFEACLAVVVDDGNDQPLQAKALAAEVGTGLAIHLIRSTQNEGITAALNKGLNWIVKHTTASYIARLDCRDICHPDRFFEQVAFLNTHLQIGLLGTWCRFYEERTGLLYDYKTPTTHQQIKKAMPLRNVFIHPTVMLRAEWVQKGERYLHQFPHAEDYGFFWRLLQITEGAVLPRYLVTCAINRGGISYKYRKEQLNSRRMVIKKYGGIAWINKVGLIKIFLLKLVPKGLLLRLKGLRNNT